MPKQVSKQATPQSARPRPGASRPGRRVPEAATDPWVRLAERGILPAAVDQVLTDQRNRFRVDPLAYIERRCFLEYTDPQARWVNGSPMGNGDLGVIAYGPPDATTFNFAKTDLWDYSSYGKADFPAVDFPELRRILAADDAEAFVNATQRTAAQPPHRQITPKNGGMLRLELFSNALAMKFRQRLSVVNAETEQSWIPVGERRQAERGFNNQGETVTLNSFVHAARNVFAVAVAPDAGIAWRGDLHFTFWRYDDPDMERPKCRVDGQRFWVTQALPGGEHFVLMGTVDCAGLKIQECGGKITGAGKPGQRVLHFYVTLVTSKDTADPLAQAHANITDALQAGFDHLRATHRQWWHDYWRRGFVCTPWEKAEWAWYYSLYLLASISRPGRLSPGLQGNWIMENWPAWNADFHTNINMQVLFWGQYAANRLELAEPYYKLFSDILPRVKADTASYFKMRGARYPLAMGPDGAGTCRNPLLLATWIGAGGFLAQNYWWHYRYSGDREFLRKYAYPMLKECALFYEDYLQEDAAGKLSLFPTIFMEVNVYVVGGAGPDSSWDLPLVIRNFQMALAAAEELGLDKPQQQRWADILRRLNPIPANAQGVWTEFSDKGGLWHMWDWARLMSIFPAELVGDGYGPPELQQQARATLDELLAFRKDEILKYTSFSGVMTAVALLRMGYAKSGLAVAEATRQALSPSGFVTSHDAYYIQVDAPPGMSVMLSEMLLQSFDGILRIFPAIPDTDQPVRFHSLRAQGGFLVSAEWRERRTQYVVIQSLNGNPLRMRNPFVNEPDSGVRVVVYELWEQTQFASVADQTALRPYRDHIYLPGQIIEFPTRPGPVYLVSKENPMVTNIPIVVLQ